MGCNYSKTQREEMVTRCRARKRYTKQLVKARKTLSASLAAYLSSLLATGSALLHFSTTLNHQSPPPPSTTGTVALPGTEENDDDGAAVEEVSTLVHTDSKDLVEVFTEISQCFLKAASSGENLSCILDTSSSKNNFCNQMTEVNDYGCTLTPSLWTWGSCPCPKANGSRNLQLEDCTNTVGSHCATLERLYGLEKVMYKEVKNAETLKVEHERMLTQLKKLETKTFEEERTERTKHLVQKLETQMVVAAEAIETTSVEINKLRETELYPQLIELVNGLMCMWRSMCETHQEQTQIVEQLKHISIIPSVEPTSHILIKSTLQLEFQIGQWYQSFCDLVKAQQSYIQPLSGWLRLSLFQFNKHQSDQESRIYSLCEEWQLGIDRVPHKLASEGLNSFSAVIHAIVIQHAEEHKQKMKAEELEKKLANTENKSLIEDKMRTLKAKAEVEKTKHEKIVQMARTMSFNSLQTELPKVFQAMVEYASGIMEAYESLYSQAQSSVEEEHAT